jgi:hypothetical protein
MFCRVMIVVIDFILILRDEYKHVVATYFEELYVPVTSFFVRS